MIGNIMWFYVGLAVGWAVCALLKVASEAGPEPKFGWNCPNCNFQVASNQQSFVDMLKYSHLDAKHQTSGYEWQCPEPNCNFYWTALDPEAVDRERDWHLRHIHRIYETRPQEN